MAFSIVLLIKPYPQMTKKSNDPGSPCVGLRIVTCSVYTNRLEVLHSAAPSGSWCGGQRQLSAANGSLVLGGCSGFNHHGVVLGCTLQDSVVGVGRSRPYFVGSNEPLFVGKLGANRWSFRLPTTQIGKLFILAASSAQRPLPYRSVVRRYPASSHGNSLRAA